MTLSIRSATAADAALVHTLVRELALYESLEGEMTASPDDLAAALGASPPHVSCDIAEEDGAAVGAAVWYYTFSTFVGRRGIFLDDLFVRPAHRGKGVGKALLVHLAQRCAAEGLGRLDWYVLDWNAPAIGFYEAQGAEIHREWLPVRVSGAALARLGAEAAT
ncbi:GNAT family N-acetyltransferase [Methylobrevis pamukkalensis]|uniref:Putative acetyltransferase n=1 Tax=Methylobrevis pamukkalensis TaxID=1439726 RepID=A0A1E3H5D3_9HYPH|nr:GNAT family N-acetyltransferase [Methylobrevis pamukkalensis]ODN70721.1 putative acetyltransferase [Methylobrevis pamukkalensis]